MKRAIALASLLALSLGTGLAPAQETTVDDPGGFWSILPPGQEGHIGILEAADFFGNGNLPPTYIDQRPMYDALAREWPALTTDNIEDYFKPEAFALAEEDIVSIEEPKEGVTIVRDTFGVPHIFGATDQDAIWGAGYVTADDRMFFTDVLRHLGRARLAEFLGASEANLDTDLDVARVAGYSEAELQFQIDQLPLKFGSLGQLTVAALDAYTDGMNAWISQARINPALMPAEYPALQLPLQDWKPTDSVAVAVLVQATFAASGGGEVRNAQLLQAIQERFSGEPERAEALFHDLLVREDPEAPVSSDASFPYQPIPGDGDVDPAAVAIPDTGSVTLADPIVTLREALAEVGINLPERMSNWLAVDAEHAADGIPIGILGPQTGYFAPEILLEMALHGPSIHSRGAAFPGISLNVLLGRGTDFAWSATSSDADNVDIRVELLCEPDGSEPTLESQHYVLHDICTPMYTRTDRYVAKPSAGSLEDDGLPAEPTVVTLPIERSVHGPVFGRATVDGAPVALSLQRSTFFGEFDSAPAFFLLNSNRVHDPETFFEAMNFVTGAFNWLYVDHTDVAYFQSCLCPVRADGVDPEFPTWGTGEWEWQGFLPLEDLVHVTLGPGTGTGDGYITSWNNKAARDWAASDSNYSYGPIYRSLSLDERIEQHLEDGPLSVVDMIQVMADAATVDLRAAQLLPEIFELLDDREAVSDEVALLQAWFDDGANRVDADQDGNYERDAAITLFDAWWNPMLDGVLDEILELPVPMGRDDGNRRGHLGSAFQSGWYGWTDKALRQALGDAPGSPLDEIACGDGTAAGCADVLEASLVAAAEALGDPATWHTPKESEEIRFRAVGVAAVPPIDWQNRPTFQQVVQVQRDRIE